MKWGKQAGGHAPANSEKGGQINICPSPELCLYQQNLNTEKSRIPPNKKVWRLGKTTPPNEICSQGNYINFRSPHGLGIADDQIECALKSVISILDGQIGAIYLYGATLWSGLLVGECILLWGWCVVPIVSYTKQSFQYMSNCLITTWSHCINN